MLDDRVGRRIFATLLALVLAFSLIPFARSSAYAEPGASELTAESLKSEMLSDEGIAGLLAEAPYTEGEALVVVDNTVEARGSGAGMRSADLLASAEPLMDASAASLAEATGIEVADSGISPLSADDEGAGAVSIQLVKAAGMSTEDLLYALRDDPRVISAEPNYTYSLADPDEASRIDMSSYIDGATGSSTSAVVSPSAVDGVEDLTNYQWAYSASPYVLKLAGQTANLDMKVPLWQAQRNDPLVANATGTVAIVDTGIDYEHPDLAPVMRTDMVGFAGYGSDCGFAATPSTAGDGPMDDHYHGTHVAGIVAAQWNDYGVSGIASGTKLVAVKAGAQNGTFGMNNLIAGYAYLADAVHGGLDDLVSINNSWGGPSTNYSLALAVTELGRLGAISVFSSGNETTNTDHSTQTDSSLRSNPYAVVVNSATRYSELSWFTNYGLATTDVFAPGSTILSTFPRAKAAYLPEATDGNIIFESFQDTNPDVARALVHSAPDSTAALGTVQIQAYYDSTGGSLRVPLSALDQVSGNELDGYMTVKAGSSDPADIRYFGWHYYTDGSPSAALALYAEVVTSEGTKDWQLINRATAGQSISNEWMSEGCDIAAACADAGVTLALDGGGAFKLKFRLLTGGSPFDTSKDLYIDAVGVAGDGTAVPYSYASGTSMASPAAAGAAAIMAVSEDTDDAAADRAAERAMNLRGSVAPIASMVDKCASGGSVDLDVFAAGQQVPVVLGASAGSSSDGTATVSIAGGFFGATAGTVTIGGELATVVSWAEDVIVVECPTGVSSGVLNVRVESAAGRVGQRDIALELPSPPADQATPLYENEYTVPEIGTDPASAMDGAEIAGLGGKLYLLPRTTEDFVATQLWALDLETQTWSRCADLPKVVYAPTMAAYEKTMLVGGIFEDSDGDAVWSILQYDPATDSWTDTGTPLTNHSSLANIEGMLVSVGGTGTHEDTGLPYALDEIRAIDLKAKTSTIVGHLETAVSEADVSAGGPELIVGRGVVFDDQGQGSYYNGYARYWYSNGQFSGGDDLGAIPTFDQGGANNYRLAVVGAGHVALGFTALDPSGSGASEDEDTYFYLTAAIPYGSEVTDGNPARADARASQFEGFGKRFMRGQTYNQAVAAYDGQLYAIGYLNGGAEGWALRSTAIDTYPAAGDTIYHPDPTPQPLPTPGGDPNVLAKTGDGMQIALVSWLAAAGLALLVLLLSGGLRRTGKAKRSE